MTDQQLYRVPAVRRPTSDAFRTLVLILATTLVSMAVVASVPDRDWEELNRTSAAPLPDWHGNVASERKYD